MHRGCRWSLPPLSLWARDSEPWPHLSVCSGLGSGWARGRGRPGEAGHSRWVPRSLGVHGVPARACWVLPGTRLYTEGNRGPGVEATWGAPTACAASAPRRAPGRALDHAWVCQEARGRNIPLVCRVPTSPGGAGSSRPAPLPASSGDPGRGGPVLAQVELDVTLARPILKPRFLPRQQDGAPGCTVPGARIRLLGRVRRPASPLRTVGVSGEQRWLLWLRGGDLPAGHTARGVGAPGLKAQPNGWQRRGRTPALRTARPVRPS